MERFIQYLKQHFDKNENLNLVEYKFKNAPESLTEYYKNLIKDKKIVWTPDTLAIITAEKTATEEELSEIKKEAAKIKKEQKKSTYKAEDIPNWYYEFYKNFKGLSLYRGSISLNKALTLNMLTIKPKCLNGKYYIGQYADITPKSCPIFTNEKGNIFVYDAKTFRNYPINNNKKEIKQYLNQDVKQIAYWDNIEDFLLEECERLHQLYIKNPSIYAIKDCSPKV